MAASQSSGKKANAQAGRGCGMAFGAIWIAFSSIFVVVGLMSTWDAAKTRTWEEVPCAIDRFEIRSEVDAEPPFLADLSFRYQVDGRELSGTQLWWDKKGDDDYELLARARAEILQGPEGTYEHFEALPSSCLVNPDDPAEAALLASSGESLWGGLAFAVFGGGFVLIGIGLLQAVRKGGNETSARSKSSPGQNKQIGGLLAAGFFGVFAFAGLGIFFGLVVPSGLNYLDARGWEQAPAEVVWSKMRSKRSDDGTTYRPDIFYRYTFDGRDYASNRYTLFDISSSGRSGKQQVVRAHPAGHRFTCYVNPDDPQSATVVRTLGWSALFGLFPLPFMAVGLGGLWYTFVRKPRADQLERKSPRKVPALRDDKATTSLREAGHLGSGLRKRLLVLGGSLIAALFWNGIVSVFVWQAWKSWQRDDPEWFLMIFLTPFVLIGLFLSGNLVYRLLAVFSPRYEMSLADHSLRPGSRSQVRWKRTGGRGKPSRFTIYLVGLEEATYQQGTSTSTASSVFHEEILFETKNGLMMPSGRCDLRLAADALPSFSAEHNKIRWLLRLIADVPWQPDVRDEHELEVRPLEANEIPS